MADVAPALSVRSAGDDDPDEGRPGILTRPPGWIFLGAALGVAVLLLEPASRLDTDLMIAAGVLWLGLVTIAVLRFLGWLVRARGLRSAGAWLRWGAAAAILLGSLWLALSDVPLRVRWSLSRDPLDAMAASVLAGDLTRPGWVGLYPPGRVERVADGMRFATGSMLFWTNGLAYVPDAVDPNEVDDWGSGTYEPLGSGWWAWADHGWDD